MQCLIVLFHSFCFFPLGTAGSSSNSTWYCELPVLISYLSSSLALPSASGNKCLTYLITSLLHYYYNPPLPPEVRRSLPHLPAPHNPIIFPSVSGNTCLTYLTTSLRPVATGLVFSGTFQNRCPPPLKRLSRISRSSPGGSRCFYSP
jgi:hypothetical protein